jgi:hypothetical protein
MLNFLSTCSHLHMQVWNVLNMVCVYQLMLSKAVAVTANGDKQGYYGCSFTGYQDTLYVKAGKQYYSNCYIEGMFLRFASVSFYSLFPFSFPPLFLFPFHLHFLHFSLSSSQFPMRIQILTFQGPWITYSATHQSGSANVRFPPFENRILD